MSFDGKKMKEGTKDKGRMRVFLENDFEIFGESHSRTSFSFFVCSMLLFCRFIFLGWSATFPLLGLFDSVAGAHGTGGNGRARVRKRGNA